ncbi:methylated-dna-[protein]-cysteine s-methyltransferase active site [Lucifera butyrica]|uniref:methylated-DNA--[protein]-cysteine S-methyltransferase n=1 Tax=Lucifera butyrica TaxID=1351585 RepID=A0A498R256_9FIRM|nr:methylated-DNA--[protein]-cysteine S-methyltransferase [Lucifera butyrica]VBB05471.1 methylated-dna-[protein]-cysteine s-methyltransferase active site [Lucifera butyrica]
MQPVFQVLSTDWGYMAAVWSERGLWELSFPRPQTEQALADLNSFAAGPVSPVDERGQELRRELNIYFRGFPVSFTVPVDWRGYTAFQAAVLKYTAQIPYGQSRNYGETAAAAGSPRGARAAGGALHSNRTPIVVPCHRVVGSNGSLTGFGGGLEMKKALLLLEKILP